jgi:hypothetical protein
MEKKAKFTKFEKGNNWTSGTVGILNFEAKLFDEPSKYGINNGRVSKLHISYPSSQCILNYDRGWDIEPEPQYLLDYFKVMVLLENAPKTRFK